MARSSTFWPDESERRLLGRFYIGSFVAESLNAISPFEFIFLFLIMERPEWAVIPLLVEQVSVFVMEIPTGVIADRFGRKISVLTGDLISVIAYVLIPAATTLTGTTQLVAVCACFLVEGVGQTLVSGAEEAWVVDHLEAEEREDLIDRYFARNRSVGSIGGVIAGSMAFLILAMSTVDRSLLNLLWYLAALGQFLSIVFLLRVPEAPIPKTVVVAREGGTSETDDRQDDDHEEDSGDLDEEDEAPFFRQTLDGFKIIWRSRALFTFLAVTLVITVATAVTSDAFEISLISKGFDARYIAPLGILNDLLGIVMPLLGVALARRLGVNRTLALLIVLPVVASGFLFTSPGLGTVIALVVFFKIIDDLWDPVAEARLQALIPSRVRATVGSIANQFTELFSMASLGVFTLMLGANSDALREATPDLIEAFSGGGTTSVQVPVAWFGLPLPDLAVVLFTAIGLIAIPILMIGRSKTDEQEKGE